MTKQTIDLVETRMDAMGEEDRLLWLIILLASQSDACLHHPPTKEHEDYDTEKSNIILVPVEGNMRFGGQAAFFVGESFEVRVDQIETTDEDKEDEVAAGENGASGG